MPGGGNDLVIDMVVAWADANSGEPVWIAVRVGSATQLLEGSAAHGTKCALAAQWTCGSWA